MRVASCWPSNVSSENPSNGPVSMGHLGMPGWDGRGHSSVVPLGACSPDMRFSSFLLDGVLGQLVRPDKGSLHPSAILNLLLAVSPPPKLFLSPFPMVVTGLG